MSVKRMGSLPSEYAALIRQFIRGSRREKSAGENVDVYDTEAEKPRDLDDPFTDPVVQFHIGHMIAKLKTVTTGRRM